MNKWLKGGLIGALATGVVGGLVALGKHLVEKRAENTNEEVVINQEDEEEEA